MSLPTPNLDDRTFQDLVDEAKRMVQRKWPEWTGWSDHNVSDPGVTLIETFAYMVDQLIYRLNRVPDLTYVKLLELIGVTLQPPTAAIAPVTFWLSAPQPSPVKVPASTEVCTERTELTNSVVFRTTKELVIPNCSLLAVGTTSGAISGASSGVGARASSGSDKYIDKTDDLAASEDIALFSDRPTPGDCFYVGLSNATPSCAVALRFLGDVQGYGINPDRPPRTWQAWTGNAWTECEIERDETGGFNRPGVVVLHIPSGHVASTRGRWHAGWLRCSIIEPAQHERQYDASPRVRQMEAFTIGATTESMHGEEIINEELGVSDGVPGQHFLLQHKPVLFTLQPEVLEVITELQLVNSNGAFGEKTEEVQEWRRVDSFANNGFTSGGFADNAAGSGADERCFVIDSSTGVLHMPPAVRQIDGSLRRFGAVAPAGAKLRLRSYRTGGGRSGNIAAHTLRSLRTSIPAIHSVDNRRGALGGVDGESLEEAKVRSPLMLRTRDRAVTAGDFEYLTLEAAPNVARVHCTAAASSAIGQPGVVQVFVVPDVSGAPITGRLNYEELRPSVEMMEQIREYLDERRIVGTNVVVSTPAYQGVTVVARLRAKSHAMPERVENDAIAALYRYYHPVHGGPEHTGWPFGRPVQAGEVHAVLQSVQGVDFVEESLLFSYNPETGVRDNTPRERIDLKSEALVFSFAHEIRVGAPQ